MKESFGDRRMHISKFNPQIRSRSVIADYPQMVNHIRHDYQDRELSPAYKASKSEISKLKALAKKDISAGRPPAIKSEEI